MRIKFLEGGLGEYFLTEQELNKTELIAALGPKFILKLTGRKLEDIIGKVINIELKEELDRRIS